MTVAAHDVTRDRTHLCPGLAGPGMVLTAIAEVAAIVDQLPSIDALLELAAAKAAQLSGHTMALVLRAGPTAEALEVVASHGIPHEHVKAMSEHPTTVGPGRLGESPTSRAFRSGSAVVATSPDEPLPAVWRHTSARAGIRSVLSLPISAGSAVHVLNIYCAERGCFDAEAVVVMENYANLLGHLMRQHARAWERTRDLDLQRRQLDRLQARCRANRLAMVHLSDLHAVVTGGSDLQRLLASMRDMTGADLTVRDAAGRLLARAERAEVSTSPIRREVSLDGDTVATLEIALESEVGTQGEVASVLHAAPSLIAMMLMRRQAAVDAQARLQGDLIEELLSAPTFSDTMAMHALSRWGVDLSAPTRLVVARIDRPDGDGSPAPGVDRAVLTAADDLVARTSGAHLVAEFDEHLVILTGDVSGEESRAFAGALQRELTAFSRGAVITVAVAPSCATVDEHRDAYQDALGVLDLLGSSNGTTVVATVEGLGLLRLLLGVKDRRALAAFAAATLQPVIDYDDKRRAELVDTLRTYLDSGCSLAATAARLHLHANSVGYRLKRIADLLDVGSIAEPAVLVRLELALQIDRLIGLSAPSMSSREVRASPERPRSPVGPLTTIAPPNRKAPE